MISPGKNQTQSSPEFAGASPLEPGHNQSAAADRLNFLFADQNDLGGIIKHINSGLPFSLFEQLCHKLHVSRATLASVLQFSLTTLNRGRERKLLNPSESERLARIVRLFEMCTLQLGSEEESRLWLTTPNQDLDWKSPLKFSQHEFGARRVEDLIVSLGPVSKEEK